MTGGPRPQCEASVVVFGADRRCLADAGHSDRHHYNGECKEPVITWHNQRWQSMTSQFTGAWP